MTRQVANLVGPTGSVVGIDQDAEVIALARHDATVERLRNVAFRVSDATTPRRGSFDVAYARFLLSHVADPGAVVSAMVRSAAPGGVVILEDTDFGGGFCYPPCPAYDRFCELFRATVRRRGGNADIGPASLRCSAKAASTKSRCASPSPRR